MADSHAYNFDDSSFGDSACARQNVAANTFDGVKESFLEDFVVVAPESKKAVKPAKTLDDELVAGKAKANPAVVDDGD